MAFWKALPLLVLAGTYRTSAQTYANGPFQLRISSQFNTSISGHAYPCLDNPVGLCYLGGAAVAPPAGDGFFFTSRARADYTVGYLSWRNDDEGGSAAAVTAYGPVGLIYDPGTNVAVPILNQTGAPETLGFDAATGDLMMTGIDDTVMGHGNGSLLPSAAGSHDRYYNNWYLCFVQLDQTRPPERLVSWVLGANLGFEPTNPTCQSVNLTMETTAVGYGGG
ncbi:hypothetical protein F4804DRAFT_289312 [Jackrogersella minutella]|nr:hypothetical protein F4804DRAFT_289312 [Jackrogersella minutella]